MRAMCAGPRAPAPSKSSASPLLPLVDSRALLVVVLRTWEKRRHLPVLRGASLETVHAFVVDTAMTAASPQAVAETAKASAELEAPGVCGAAVETAGV